MPTELSVEILLVEDSEPDIELTLHALRRERLTNRIMVLRDGQEALDYLFHKGAFQSQPQPGLPRLILLDLKLPKVDGLEVLRQLKADPATRAIPVVALTSSREDRDLGESYALGVNSYIQKPVDFAHFRDVVKQVGLYWLVINQVPPVGQASAYAGLQSRPEPFADWRRGNG